MSRISEMSPEEFEIVLSSRWQRSADSGSLVPRIALDATSE